MLNDTERQGAAMAEPGEKFFVGDEVPHSGIYKVMHDTEHREPHEVTCIKGTHFPPCHGCGDGVEFELVRKAKHIADSKHFR